MSKLKNKYVFLITIIIIGIVVGIIFANILNETDQKLVYNKLTTYFQNIKDGNSINYGRNFLNIFYQNNIYLIIIWILGLSIVGIVGNIFLLFYKSFILGFTIGSIINIYLYKGLLLAFIYIFPHMILNIVIILYIIYYANNFSMKLINVIFFKKDIKLNNYFKRYGKVLLICFVATLLTTVLETFLLPLLLKAFTFLLK